MTFGGANRSREQPDRTSLPFPVCFPSNKTPPRWRAQIVICGGREQPAAGRVGVALLKEGSRGQQASNGLHLSWNTAKHAGRQQARLHICPRYILSQSALWEIQLKFLTIKA